MELSKITLDGIRHIHLMGIGGAGMSGLALLLKELGFIVSGCDMSYGFYVNKVTQAHIDFDIGHNPDHLEKFTPDLVVYSSAIPENNHELVAARKAGILVAKRAQVLSAIFDARYGIGVAGTHGKTTTSSMISLILNGAELEPTVAIGGELCDIGCNARLGNGPHMVAELDESDGSFLSFHPTISVITNVDWDHVNHYPSLDSVLESFEGFSRNVRTGGALILCGEDAGVRRLLKVIPEECSQTTYGFDDQWDWGALDIRYNQGGGVSFIVRKGDHLLGRLELAVSGDHNVLNALAACAVADMLSVPFSVIATTLRQFQGAKRRLQFKGSLNGIDIYDDYDHHPREVEATLKAVNQIFPDRSVLVIFQPHRYTRTAAMADEFARVLKGADKVLLLPIYPADEEPLTGVTSALIGDVLSQSGHPCFTMLPPGDDVVPQALSMINQGDVVLTIGAGDVADVGDLLVKSLLRQRSTSSLIAVSA